MTENIQNRTEDSPTLELLRKIYSHNYSIPDSAQSENRVVKETRKKLAVGDQLIENTAAMIAFAATRIRAQATHASAAELLLVNSLTITVTPIDNVKLSDEAQKYGRSIRVLMKVIESPELAFAAAQAGLLASNNQSNELNEAHNDMDKLRKLALKLEAPTAKTVTNQEPKLTLGEVIKQMFAT